jgi:hypothetical protein
MICRRCQGLMVEDFLMDLEEAYEELWIRGWRCLCCGDVSDPLIEQRRMERGAWNRFVAETLSE